jgi:hypothetical protein
MALLLAHCLILGWFSLGAATRLTPRFVDRLLAAGLLAWGNIVLTSLLLAAVNRLGEPAWFFRASLLLGAVTWLLLRRLPAVPAPAPAGDKADLTLLVAFIVTLAPIAYAGVRIAAAYEPNNYDSLAYHLPRAMFYLGQENLAHFATGNPRQIYFPFNYNLLQLAALIYSPGLQPVNFINLAAWAAAGLGIFRLCRQAACTVNTSLIATWLALTATQVLAQATATTNDLPTGAALLGALVFALNWRESGRARDAWLTALAAGLTVGSKLTVIFFVPAGGLLLLFWAWQHWRRAQVGAFATGVRAWLAPAALAAVLAAPFALINLAEKGEWMNKTYDFTLNRPFKFGSFVQTAEAYLVQLFIEPFHRFSFNLQFTEQLNEWGTRTFFPHWNAAYAFSPLYLFPPDLNEDHVFFGFAGPVIFLCAVYCLLRPARIAAPARWLAWIGLGWFATYFLLNKWSLYNQRYFVPAILVLSPCLAAALEAWRPRPIAWRYARLLLAALAVTSVWLDTVYLFSNTSRPYAPLFKGDPVPPALPALPALMAQRMATQPAVNVDSYLGNERIFLLMAQRTHQRFTAREEINPDMYNVICHWGFPRRVAYSNIEQLSSYIMVPVPSKRTAGVEFLGTLGADVSAIDYCGLVPHANETASADGDRNVLVTLSYGPREPGRYARTGIKVAGLNPRDQARLVISTENQDGTTTELAAFTATGATHVSITRPFKRILCRVYDQATGAEIGQADIPYLAREAPPTEDTSALFSTELVSTNPKPSPVSSEGLAAAEGPYPHWNLPLFRWAKSPVVHLAIPATEKLARIRLSFGVRLHVRESADLDIVFNGRLVQHYRIEGSGAWLDRSIELPTLAGINTIEFRNVTVGQDVDWQDYLERYRDVKDFMIAHNIPLEQGAKEHYEAKGKSEGRTVNLQRQTATAPEGLYFAFRRLHVEGFPSP